MGSLTTKELQALTAADNGRRLADGHGVFGVVRAGAQDVTVQFSLRYRVAGRVREMRLGTFPKSSLRQIRDARDGARARISSGEDPLEHKRIEKLKKRAEVDAEVQSLETRLARRTFRQRFNEWAASALQKRADKGQEIRRAFEKDVLPVVGDMAMEDVRRSHIMSALDAIIARGANRLANRTLTDLKQFMKWCQAREYVAVDPLLMVLKKDVGGTDGERERTLSDHEISALPKALDAANLPKATKHALMLILATNARVGEVIKARKRDINLELKIWRIPFENAKNGDPHVVFLSDLAVKHMRALIDLSDSEEWLLPAPRRGEQPETHVGLKSITKQVSDRQLVFYERAPHAKRTANTNSLVIGDEKWTPHDLRRTAATLMQSIGVLPAVIDKCMNHREQNRMKRIYQRYPYTAEKRDAWQLLGARLEQLTRQDAPSEHLGRDASTKDRGHAAPTEAIDVAASEQPEAI
ncbi:Site-specific integrase [Paraburkholderia kururiensis]|uniref:tyrosine-type recombinase/integrase n=1 Tax=Paraburkholderia kururiensis TaxID=984307 RepID=UPI0039A6879A